MVEAAVPRPSDLPQGEDYQVVLKLQAFKGGRYIRTQITQEYPVTEKFHGMKGILDELTKIQAQNLSVNWVQTPAALSVTWGDSGYASASNIHLMTKKWKHLLLSLMFDLG